MYGKELRCLNTKGKYGKVTNTEIKWSIISKSVMVIIFVEFIDQLIDYPINRVSLIVFPRYFFGYAKYISFYGNGLSLGLKIQWPFPLKFIYIYIYGIMRSLT